MRTFKDKTGKPYTIDLTVGAVLRVKQQSEGRFDLFDPESKHDGERTLASVLFAERTSDWATIWELLYLIVQPQLGDGDAAQFGEAMASDCLVAAQRVLLEEWRDFFRGLGRPDLAVMVEKQAKYQAKALELVTAKLNDPRLTAIDQRVEQKMESTLNSSLGDLEASLEPILGPSPSGS